MRSNRLQLGMVAVAALLVPPCSALAQTAASTDAAMVEMRQLFADQRAALDRQGARLMVQYSPIG